MKELLVGICLSVLLLHQAWAGNPGRIEVDVLAQTGTSWDGSVLPEYGKGNPEVTILRITIPPGAKLPLHRHPVINAGVLLKGELTVVTQNQETLHLGAGDAIVEVVDTWHYGMNKGEEPAEIIVFYAGFKDHPFTEKQ